VFFENGKKKEKGNYYMGQKSGKWKFYDQNGKLIEKKTFEKPKGFLQY
jgi:antitoxin component YwqK of YwqJK toxin-antitoxin module